MKKFVFRIIIYILIIVVVCAGTFLLDPFNVQHIYNIRDVGVEPNSNYIKMTYILENPEKFNSFIFGSSRVGNLNPEKIEDVRCYNMTYAEGAPSENYNNLSTLIDNGIVPEKVFLGVDSLSCAIIAEDHYSQAMRAPYEYLVAHPLEFVKLYCDPAVNLKVIRNVFYPKENSVRFSEKFYDCGCNTYYGATVTYDKEHAVATVGPNCCMQEVLNAISDFVVICKEYDIELIVFTNPLHPVTLKESFNCGYETFLRELVKITPFYNFSSLNDITNDWDNFYDTSHATAEVGDIELEYLQGIKVAGLDENGGFGLYVTEDNINDLIESIINQIKEIN